MFFFAQMTSGLILLALSGIHFYWLAGRTFGMNGVIPEIQGKPAFRPGKLATAAVGLILFSAALFPLGLGIQTPFGISRSVLQYGTTFLSAAFLLRAIGDFRLVGFFKRIKDTKFAKNDTKYYSPLCLLLSALLFVSTY
ncbi:DUF3995 domain-containing protein [Leptospira alstonii]|uniref:DUF3995 domain-containing protein n=1 Tax=Leptospira alstonii TaxID=28452 RepID=UPI0007747FB0|nr:DUF3995 domain-containing protein [Leptospira alstonii]